MEERGGAGQSKVGGGGERRLRLTHELQPDPDLILWPLSECRCRPSETAVAVVAADQIPDDDAADSDRSSIFTAVVVEAAEIGKIPSTTPFSCNFPIITRVYRREGGRDCIAVLA